MFVTTKIITIKNKTHANIINQDSIFLNEDPVFRSLYRKIDKIKIRQRLEKTQLPTLMHNSKELTPQVRIKPA